MGKPQKYSTDEEKRQARREYHHRYWEKHKYRLSEKNKISRQRLKSTTKKLSQVPREKTQSAVNASALMHEQPEKLERLINGILRGEKVYVGI